MKTHFKVYHHNNACLGIATMNGNRVTYKTDPSRYAWFEERPEDWLCEFRQVVRRLCRSTGHNRRFFITLDEPTGISVERIEPDKVRVI